MEDFRVIEELARAEQAFSTKAGKIIGLKDTSFFKNLSKEEKINFDLQRKKKSLGKKITYSLIFLSILLIFMNQTGITSQAIGIREDVASFTQTLFIIFLIGSLVFLIFINLMERVVKKRFERHLDIIEKYT
jgi:uncharacterized membrane protein